MTMIRKSNNNLLNWIYKYILDFTDENDTSGLTWESTHKEALDFLHSIPRKERVQKYGFHSTRSHFFLTDSFDDIKEALENGFVSEETCRMIHRLYVEMGRENWSMEDVKAVLYPERKSNNRRSNKFVSNTFKQLLDLGLIECVNPEAKHGKLFRLTEKGEDIFGEI